MLAHLEGGMPLPDAIAETQRRTREFARRQRVWWRQDPRLRWYGSAVDPFDVLPQLLGEWSAP
jgi:tRNA dimethylallyltransferase